VLQAAGLLAWFTSRLE